MKKLFYFIFAAVVFTAFISCVDEDNSSDSQTRKATEKAMEEVNREVGMPAITNFQEKKNLKWIYELCDKEDFICHAYLFNTMSGTVGQYLGKCYGYGIPYSAKFTNPEKIVNGWRQLGYAIHDGGGVLSVPQPEPNGIFKPTGMSATWLIMVDPETNEPRPVYIEPEIIVSPFKLK